MAFARTDRTLFVDISYFICDGNGLAPIVKTLVYYYVEKRYDANDIDTECIRLVTDEIKEDEYHYPFPDAPIPNENALELKPKEYDLFLFGDELFDSEGSYAYNMKIKQKELMKYAKSNDGSPVSFVSVMLFKAMMELCPDTEKDIVFQIPHEYRKVLGRPLSHDCLARVFKAKLSAKDKNKRSRYSTRQSADKSSSAARNQPISRLSTVWYSLTPICRRFRWKGRNRL